VCRLLIDFPDARFVLMHIGYPYQDEYIAIAKHFANAWIDLCWAWIISPTASVRFVREFLTTAPSNKLFAFGGDYLSVETVYGHSRVARQGIVEALVGLVEDGWLDVAEASATARQIMCESARAFFPSVA
jgi:predicted TIM-barrel fold metal-dependent hydrolase